MRIKPVVSTKLIIFDLSDVLIKGLEGSEVALANELSLPVAQITEQLFSHDFHDFYIGKTTEASFLSDVISQHRWDISVGKLKKIIRNNFREIKGTRKIIKTINTKYTTVLLSVNPKEWVEYILNNFNLNNLFPAGIYFSYKIGYTKRQKEAFMYVLNKHNILAEEVLLIDDSKRNLSVAAGLGISGIRFTDPEQLLDELILRKIV